MRKLLALGLASVLVLSLLSGCGKLSENNSTASSEAVTAGTSETVKLTLSTPDPDGSSITESAKEFAKKIEEKTNGTVKVTVYPNGSLYGGDPAAGIKQLSAGGLDILTLTSAVYSSFVPEFTIISIPYLFDDADQYRDFLNSDTGKQLLSSTDSMGIKGLSFWTRSFRQITNSKRPINTPADLKGIKMRVLNNPLWVDFFTATGAVTTPMAFGEVYNALQLATIDGQENPVDIPISAKFYEVQKYLTISNHIADGWVVGMNAEKLKKLTPEQQQAIQEAAVEMQQWKVEYDLVEDQKALQELAEKGMEINEISPENQALFVEISRSLESRFRELIGNDEMYDKALEFVGKKS